MVVYTRNLNGNTNNQAKGMTLLCRLKVSVSIRLKKLVIEGDSKLIINVVKGLSKTNWSIEEIIKDIHKFILGLEHFEIGRVYMEGNMVVDSLVVLGLQVEGWRYWRRKDSLPNNVHILLHGESLTTKSNG